MKLLRKIELLLIKIMVLFELKKKFFFFQKQK
jgi:hypothetical protein